MPNDPAATAHSLVASGKGILAADESTPTIAKRFEKTGVEPTEENRRRYREVLLTTPGLSEFISGVILFDETARQKSNDGISFPDLLHKNGIIPGIKVDDGAKPLANFLGEKITEGLDGLRKRFNEYRELNLCFSKWRAVIKIGNGIPSRTCMTANAEALARFAALSQEVGMVPIVEPEVLMDGDHMIQRCEEVTGEMLKLVFDALGEHHVALEQMLLKPNMVLPGEDCVKQASVEEVARATIRCLRRFVPSAVPGIIFLSGGQSDTLATQHLNAINELGPAPWQLSFSFGRALQQPALAAWAGNDSHASIAQNALHHRAHCNSLARFGKYTDDLERSAKPAG